MKSRCFCTGLTILYFLFETAESSRCSWGRYKNSKRVYGYSNTDQNIQVRVVTNPEKANKQLNVCKDFCDQSSRCHGFEYGYERSECVFEYTGEPEIGYSDQHDYYICLDPKTHAKCNEDPDCDFVYPCYDRKKLNEKRCHQVMGEMKMCVKMPEDPFPWLNGPL